MKATEKRPSEAIWDNACNNAACPKPRAMTMKELSAAVEAIAEREAPRISKNEYGAQIIKLAMVLGADYAWKIIYEGGSGL